jgi:hypothetical protein
VTDHVVIDIKRGAVCICLRCKAEEPITLPCSVEEYTARVAAFVARHAQCEAKP